MGSPVSILFAELPVAWLNGEPGWNWEDEHHDYTNDEANGNHVQVKLKIKNKNEVI